MKVSAATPGFSCASAFAACGPCSASSARSGSGWIVQRWPMLVIRCRVSAALQAALTMSDHQIVEDAAVLVREERVALLADGEVDDVHRHERFECLGGIGTDHAQLAHVRDVEQRRGLAAVSVLFQDALGVGHRHLVAGELHHLGAELQMERVQRRAEKGLVHKRSPKGNHSERIDRIIVPPLPSLSALPERLAPRFF
jgi:hypothetical protein